MSAALIARLEALLLWAEAGAANDDMFCTSYGICTNVDAQHDIAAAALSWPEFSGNPEYPVPAPVNYAAYSEYEVAHYAAYWDRTLPLWSGEYGAARIRLLKHCIEYFKEKTA